MKYKYFIISTFFLIGCSQVTTPHYEIDRKKGEVNRLILSNFPKKIELDNAEYEHKIKLVQNILYQVNNSLYQNPYETKAIFIDTENGMATALPSDTILFTTKFLEAVQTIFTKDETTAIICHESAHILNDDWGESFRDNSSYFDYTISGKIETPNLGGIAVGYGLTRLLYPHKSDMNFKEYLSASAYTQGTYQYKEEDELTKGDLDFNLLSMQGFSVETEINTDNDALTCLKQLNINPKSMYSALRKISTIEFRKTSIVNKQLQTRIEKLGEIK